MIRCAYCGYHWQDPDEDYPSCHYEGPEGWAPCEYDDEPIEEEDEEWNCAKCFHQYSESVDSVSCCACCECGSYYAPIRENED